jgi:Fur family transcriptional regulator, ferric uptake regulator
MLGNHGEIINKLKSSGHRITKVRSLIVELFINGDQPLSVQDILDTLEKLNLRVNKTTIYRELEFLGREKIVKEIDFLEGKKRYELNSKHHHHIICINCKKVEDVDLKMDLHEEEERIGKLKNFKVLSHSLEFFGLCTNCLRTAA